MNNFHNDLVWIMRNCTFSLKILQFIEKSETISIKRIITYVRIEHIRCCKLDNWD